MDVVFGTCPECETNLKCPQDATSIRCPNCKHEFQVSNPIQRTQLYQKGKRIFVIGLLILISYFGLSAIAIFGSGDGLAILYLMPIVLVGSTVSLFGLIYMAYDKFSNGDRMVVGELAGIVFFVVFFVSVYQMLTGFNGIV